VNSFSWKKLGWFQVIHYGERKRKGEGEGSAFTAGNRKMPQLCGVRKGDGLDGGSKRADPWRQESSGRGKKVA